MFARLQALASLEQHATPGNPGAVFLRFSPPKRAFVKALLALTAVRQWGGAARAAVYTTGAFPFNLPASGQVGIISTNTLADTVGGVPRTALNTEASTLEMVLGAWGSAAQSVSRDASGNVVDFRYWIFGGGHNDCGNDGVYAYRGATAKFERMLKPSHLDPIAVAVRADGRAIDPINVAGELVLDRPDSQHAYQHVYGLDSNEGGEALMQLRASAVFKNSLSSEQSHRFDAGAKTWARAGNPAGGNLNIVCQAIVKDRKRKRFVRYPSDNGTAFFVMPWGGDWMPPGKQRAPRMGNWSDTHEATGIHDPVRDLYVVGHWQAAGSLCAVPAGDPAAPFAALRQTGAVPVGVHGNGMQYRAVTDEFLLVSAPRTLHVGKISDMTMNWTTRTFAGSVFTNAAGGAWFNRWQYIDVLDALVVCPAAGRPMECWKL